MRDLLITLIVFGSVPNMLRYPHVGVLVWSWLGYMNPHKLSWGFAVSFPFAQVTAIATLVGVMFSRERKDIPMSPLVVIWIVFIAWMGITTLLALYPERALDQFEKVIKIQLFTFITMMFIRDRRRLLMLAGIITASIGFFGVKGGIFAISSGGAYKVWGPPDSFIKDNNELALALLMTLPLMWYFRQQTTNIWARRGLLFCVVVTAFSIASSYSRGAFIASGAVLVFLWLKSRQKVMLGVASIVLVAVLLVFMPAEWHERMGTIQNYDEDSSAMGRIAAWTLALTVATQRLFGGGFDFWSTESFSRYTNLDNGVHVAHSIYFSVLGEHGWPGLFMFLFIGFMAIRHGTWIIRACRGREDLAWMADLARMVQVSLIAYSTGGAFLSLSYFDMYWHLVAIMVISKRYVQEMLIAGPPLSAVSSRQGEKAAASATSTLSSRLVRCAMWKSR